MYSYLFSRLRGIKEKMVKIFSEKPASSSPIKEITIYPNKANRFITKVINSATQNNDNENGIGDDETQTECCLCNKCSIMDTKAVKYANEIISKRNQPDPNEEILNLKSKITEQDNKIDEILRILKSKN